MYLPLWLKCRDVASGEDAVKNAGEVYLPKPDGMDNKQYDSYRTRAEFFNATGRTLDGLHGLMFSKDVTIEVPDAYRPYLDNVDGKGKNLTQFISDCAYETLRDGWGGVLLEYPESDFITNDYDRELLNVAPYMKFYHAEDIFNWHYGTMGRKQELDHVCLRDREEVPLGDDFTYTLQDRYTLLQLNDENKYQQTVKDNNGQVEWDSVPTKSGKAFDHLLFYTLPNTEPEKPFLIDLVNLNLAWYRKSADLENGAHWTGVPTPYVLGYQPESRFITDKDGNAKEVASDPIYLGGSQMLTFPQGVTSIGYLEFNGAGLSQLQNMMTQDEERMAILGARIISAEKKGVESAETARIHRAGENSVLATFANNLSNIFKKITIEYLEWCTNLEINPDDVTIHINTDYDTSRMSGSDLTALVALWQQGGISQKVLFSNLKEGEIVPNDLTFEDMQDDIIAEKESATMQNALLQGMIQNPVQNDVNNGEENV